jgi:RNA polymerase sigma factor (sigma-70 family)
VATRRVETLGAMHLTDREMTARLRHYEGLIFTTAQRLVASGVLDEAEDIQQLLRVKAWKGLRAFDPSKARGMTVDRYIFMVIRDQAKDIAKRKRVVVLLIEDQAPARGEHRPEDSPRDAFEARYLAESDEEIVRTPPLVPNTLTGLERRVLVLLYRDYKQVEIARRLACTERDVSGAVRALRAKLADWQPAGAASPAASAVAG